MPINFYLKDEKNIKNYSLKRIKINIAFYSFLKFILSDNFIFFFFFIPLFIIAMYYDFSFKVTFGILMIHPIIYLLNKPINKILNINQYKQKLTKLIKTNKEQLKQKK